MKFKLLLLSVMGSFAIANAQYTVADRAGNVLADGDVIEYGTTQYPDASYEFYVTNNNPSNEIYTRIEFVSATSGKGDGFELCYGECITGLSIGQTVPPVPEVLPIGVGETTLEGNHFFNGDPGNGSSNLDFVFAFHQYESNGTTEIGTPLTFTYRYNPTLGVNETRIVKLKVQSTVVSNQLVLTVNEPVSMIIYDLRGRAVKQANFEIGRQEVNMSDLSAQAYILQFKNEQGATQTTKIVVQ